MRYNLYLTNDIFVDSKTNREIKFSRLTIDLDYKKVKLTTDAQEICNILDITEKQLKTNYPFDGTEKRVGVLVIGESKEPKEV